MAKIADFEVPREPKTTFNVGRIGGGTSVNAIPYEAWAEVDMRSADPAALRQVLTSELRAWSVRDHDRDQALVTGYYEPLLHGSRLRYATRGVI